MTVQTELESTEKLISQVERLEQIASSLPAQDERRQVVQDVIGEMIADAQPVRAVVAARLLQVSEKTVRAWREENVLVAAQDHPRLGLALDRVHEVMHLVKDLREAGQTTGLLEEVYHRLIDAQWLDNQDLAESLSAMERGQKIPARRSR